MNKSSSTCLLLIVSLFSMIVQGFISPVSRSNAITRPKETTIVLNYKSSTLSDIDFMCEMNVAEYCTQNEDSCSLDEIEALFNLFKDQRDKSKERLEKLDALLHELGDENIAKQRDVNRIRGKIHYIGKYIQKLRFFEKP